MTASIELPNPGLKLRADMYATVTIDVPSAHQRPGRPRERRHPQRRSATSSCSTSATACSRRAT